MLTYYWPPSGGSGVQRWVYFCYYLKKLGWEPVVITVAPEKASYPQTDNTLAALVTDIKLIRTYTREPLRWYSRYVGSGSIPQGEVPQKNAVQKIAAFIRGNFFVPDARKGWIPFAQRALKSILQEEKPAWVVSTGPPHSTHLAVLPLKKKYTFKWLVDLRDPWTEVFYNRHLYRLSSTQRKDKALEKLVLQAADTVLTTVGGEFHKQLLNQAPKQRFVALANGYDADKLKVLNRQSNAKEFHLVYTGLLTRNQAFPALIQALQQLKSSLPIRFSLAGQIEADILTEITESLPNCIVDYKGYLSHDQALQLMHTADLLVNFIFKGAHSQMVSGKLLEYMATGVPVLSLGDPNSEAAALIHKGSAAKMLAATDTEGIHTFLERALAQKGAWTNSFPAKEDWSREGITKQLHSQVLEASTR